MSILRVRAVVPVFCAFLLAACGGTTKSPDGGIGGGATDAGTGGATGTAGATGTGGRVGTGGATGTGGRAGTGGRGGTTGAGGATGTACMELLTCCNATANATLKGLCMSSYGAVMAMGDAACGSALAVVKSMGACP